MYTDVFQFVMLILFVYILIPTSSLIKLGRDRQFCAESRARAGEAVSGRQHRRRYHHLFRLHLAGAEMWQRAFAARNRKSAKEGLFLGTLAYGLTIPLVRFMGVVAHQLVPAEKLAAYGSTDAVVPALAIEILPVGLTGLALAGILSVIMSTADSYLIVSVQTSVHDIYKVFRPDIPEKKELRLTRVFAVILPLWRAVHRAVYQNAYNILMFAWSFYAAAAGLPAFAALYWKKATKAVILAGMGAGFSVTIVWKLLGQPFGLGATVPGAIACALALALVSLGDLQNTPAPSWTPAEKLRHETSSPDTKASGLLLLFAIGLRAPPWPARKDGWRGFQKKRGDGDCHAHGCRLIRRYFRGISRAHRRKMQKRTDRFISLLIF
ncbi:MAG: sodium:solute symporter family protein [Blautia wexlerae]